MCVCVYVYVCVATGREMESWGMGWRGLGRECWDGDRGFFGGLVIGD